MKTPAQAMAMQRVHATNQISTARREALRLVRCPESWWIDFTYARAKQEAIRMNQQTTNYEQRKGEGA